MEVAKFGDRCSFIQASPHLNVDLVCTDGHMLTLFLTLVAFKLVIADKLPKIALAYVGTPPP